MKIDPFIRDEIQNQLEIASLLSREFTTKISIDSRCFIKARIKKAESCLLKFYTGRYEQISDMDDFFACAIVVPSPDDIEPAVQAVERIATIEERKPADAETTKKAASDFRFDELRLYCRLDKSHREPGPVQSMKFEVQVRTLLQHAWIESTHDIIYKTGSMSWQRDRIAHQAKATLEQVELLLGMISEVGESSYIPTKHTKYDQINNVIAVLRQNWPEPGDLPHDLKRLAESIFSLLEHVRFPVKDLSSLLARGRGTDSSHNRNWSPYRAVLEYLSHQQPELLTAAKKVRNISLPCPASIARRVSPDHALRGFTEISDLSE